MGEDIESIVEKELVNPTWETLVDASNELRYPPKDPAETSDESKSPPKNQPKYIPVGLILEGTSGVTYFEYRNLDTLPNDIDKYREKGWKVAFAYLGIDYTDFLKGERKFQNGADIFKVHNFLSESLKKSGPGRTFSLNI